MESALSGLRTRHRFPAARRLRGSYGPVWFCCLGIVCCVLSGCCSTQKECIPARGVVAGTCVNTCVDSVWAKYYLENYLRGQPSGDWMDEQISRALAALPEGRPSKAQLQWLSQRFSTDFATLVMAQKLVEDPISRELLALYHQELELVHQGQAASADGPLADPSSVVFLFAPVWLYETNRENQGDFRRERCALERHGIQSCLIRTDEKGTVEANACTIANTVLAFRQQGVDVVLVSGSKAGPEVAMALGTILCPEETTHVRGWLSVSGAMRGSPLVDDALSCPKRCLTAAVFCMKRWGDLSALASLTTCASRRRLAAACLPEHILTVTLVGMPLSGQISEKLQDNYEKLRPCGPNDGLVLLADQLLPGAPAVPAVGQDHYFSTFDVETHTLALSRAMLRYEATIHRPPAQSR